MKAAVLIAALLWPGHALADAAFLGPLLDSLGNAESSGTDIAEALESAGFVLDAPKILGPDSLPAYLADPYYFHVSAYVSPGQALAADGRPEMVLECSRIGQSSRDLIERGAFAQFGKLIPSVQTWSSVADFAPGALAQLKCKVDLLPLEGTVLPTTDEVTREIAARFARTHTMVGTAEAPKAGLGWVLYPPLDQGGQAEPALQLGQTLITGRNPALSGPGKPEWIVYDHFETRFMHSLGMTSHIPLFGS